MSSLSAVQLECAPVGTINVTITPSMGSVTTTLVNTTLQFAPNIPAGRTVTVQYKCAIN